MEKNRFNKVWLIIGDRGQGKTHYLINKNPNIPPVGIAIKWYQQREGRPDQRVLIIDTFRHPSYTKFKSLSLEQLKTWKKGIAHVSINRSQFKELFEIILKDIYSNCMIVFEDCSKYFKSGKPLPEEVEDFIIDSKQRNFDLVFMYHSYGISHIDVWRLCDKIVLFKTYDSPLGTKGGEDKRVIDAAERLKTLPRFAYEVIDKY